MEEEEELAVERRTLALTEQQMRDLEQLRDHDHRPYLRERAAALLKIHAGRSAYHVARYGLLKPRDPDTIYTWLERFKAEDIAGLIMKPRGKRRVPP